MIQFPLDPTHFVVPYAIVVFLLPWLISAAYAMRELRLLYQSGVLAEMLKVPILDFKAQRTMRLRFYEEHPVADALHRRLIRCAIITIALWVVGFTILGSTLYWMEKNDLLINHSKGLYGPSEAHERSKAPNHRLEATG